MQAGEIRKGSHLMIKGNPCKCIEVSTSKTGKHGHAKAHIVALDIFTGKKMEELCPCSHNLAVPFVTRTEYTVMDIAGDGQLSLLTEGGEEKNDMNLPASNDDDAKLSNDIKKDFGEGKNVIVTVQSACGQAKVILHKVADKAKPDKAKVEEAGKEKKVKVETEAPGKISAEGFLRNLASEHGLPAEHYAAPKTQVEWEKLVTSLASKIFSKHAEL